MQNSPFFCKFSLQTCDFRHNTPSWNEKARPFIGAGQFQVGENVLRLSANRCEGEGLTICIVGFKTIGRCSPSNLHSLSFTGDVSFVFGNGLLEDLALRAQPQRLGNVHASVAAALALRGCRLRCNYLTASTKTFSPSASDSCKPAVESFQMIAFA